jgi:hypothetical protein
MVIKLAFSNSSLFTVVPMIELACRRLLPKHLKNTKFKNSLYPNALSIIFFSYIIAVDSMSSCAIGLLEDLCHYLIHVVCLQNRRVSKHYPKFFVNIFVLMCLRFAYDTAQKEEYNNKYETSYRI